MVDITTPTVGGDEDAWGGILNTALTTLESAVTTAESDILGKVSKSGDTLTGSLNLGIANQINIGASGSSASVAVRRSATSDAALSTRVGAETGSRFFVNADGAHQWADGTAGADTNLYRSGADALKTDDLFSAAGVNSTTNGASVAGLFATSADGTAALGTVVINPFSANKRALDIRLAGDALSRLRVDMSAGTGSGTLIFGNGTIADTNLYRGGTDVLQTDDYFVMPTGQSSGKFNLFGGTADALDLGTAGGGIAVTEGSNARMGVATLVAGTVVVNNTSVTANTRIFLTAQTTGAAPGALRISARTPATSFTITSSSGTDTSSVAWVMFEPS